MSLYVLLHNPYFALAIALWEMAWKGMALWRASQKSQKPWFIALLIVNTIGLLPIIYLLMDKYSKKKDLKKLKEKK
jgi:hypothetical protein